MRRLVFSLMCFALAGACTTDLADRFGVMSAPDAAPEPSSHEFVADNLDASSPDATPNQDFEDSGRPGGSASTEPLPTSSNPSHTDAPEAPHLLDAAAGELSVFEPDSDAAATPPRDAGNGPVLLGTQPANGAEGVGVGVDVVLDFDRPITAGSGLVILIEVADVLTVEEVPISDARATFLGEHLRIDWDTTLARNTTYAVLVQPGAIVDAQGQPFLGITDAEYFVFTTEPPAPIELVATNPTPDATTVSVQSNVTLTFNVEISAGAVGTIAVVQASTGAIFAEASVASSERVALEGTTLTFDPSFDLAHGEGYYVTLDRGAVRSKDGATFVGFDDEDVLSFATEPPPEPLLVGTAPLDDALEVDPDANLVLTFDRPVQAGEGLLSIRQSSNGDVVEVIAMDAANVIFSDVSVTIDLAEPLAGATQYYVTVDSGAIQSTLGADYAGIADAETLLFTTAVLPPPPLTLIGSIPSAGATAVAADTDIFLVFSEAVSTGSGSVTVFRAADAAVFESVSVQSERVSIVGDSVTIDLAGLLADNTGYYVTVGSGSFISARGAAFAGILSPETLAFETDDPFVLTSLSPMDDAVSVSPTSELVLTFSAAVEANAGAVTIRSADAAVVEVIAVDDARVRVENNVVTIDPSTTLQYETRYGVSVDPGAFSKVGGQDFAGISAPSGWTFTTTSACDPGEVRGTNGDCYFHSTTETTWDLARTACNRGSGWDLAAIKSSEEQNFLQGVVTQEAWIGATDQGDPDEWRWVRDNQGFWSGGAGGEPVAAAFSFWKNDQPSGGEQDCARILNSANAWRWADSLCDEEYGFVCQGPSN